MRTKLCNTSSGQDISVCFEGEIGKMLDFAEKQQLLDVELWKKFVEEYRLQVDGNDRGWRGEFWGKMMRGGALVCKFTQNKELSRILHDTVEDMLTVQDEYGRFSTYELDKEFTHWDMWARKYISLGMCYFLDICESEELKVRVINALCGHVDYIISKIGREDGKISIHQTSKWYGAVNSSSILEGIVRLYRLTENKKYLDFAEYIVSEGGCRIASLVDLALENEKYPYQYPTTKAYETMSFFEGLVEYYEATGDEKCRKAAENFAYKLAESDITVIGSAGLSSECFDHSAVRQASSSTERLMQETCVTVTWMKLCYRMLKLTGDVLFADYFERALYNGYAGALNTEKCVNDAVFPMYSVPEDLELVPTCMPYDGYTPLRRGVRGMAIAGARTLHDNTYYGCCACIGAAGVGVAPLVAAMANNDGLVLSLYENGMVKCLSPKGQELSFDIDTAYPVGGEVHIGISMEGAEKFSLMLRIPAWSKNSVLTVNGEPQNVKCGYATLTRVWNPLDKVILSFDMSTRVIPAPTYDGDILNSAINWDTGDNFSEKNTASEDTPYHVALQRGPLVLARDARVDAKADAVDVLCDKMGNAVTRDIETGIDAKCALAVADVDGGEFSLIDFASAGKTGDKVSEYEVWIPTRTIFKNK